MAGKRGMKMPADTKSVRQMLWRSMRIMLKFTIADLLRTIPEDTLVKYENVQKFVRRLVKHQYVAKDGLYKGGRAGSAQQYRLINNIGPIMPVLAIGRAAGQLTNNCENSVVILSEETKKEKETETETEKLTETQRDGGQP